MELLFLIVVIIVLNIGGVKTGYNVNTYWIPSGTRSIFRGRFK